MTQLVVLKLGGSVITKKSENKLEVNEKNLNRICEEIAEAKRKKKFKLIVVHGAGPFGHVPAKTYKLHNGLKSKDQIIGISITHQCMEFLNQIVVKTFLKNGVNAISYQPSAVGILNDQKLSYFPTNVIEKLLDLDIVPVCYGDVLIDKKRGIGILSGDHLVPYLAEKLKADRVIMAVDVDGIFDKDPKKYKNAKLIREITKKNIKLIYSIGSSSGVDVTGGMQRKLMELLDLSKKRINSEIINASKSGILKRALLGEKGLGTTIKK